MLGSAFVFGGIDDLRNPAAKVEAAETVAPTVGRVPHLPEDTKTLIRINGAVKLAAGVLLSIGRLPRLSALALAGSLVPTTWARNAFWEETDKQARAQQLVHFLKNTSIMGGLLIAAVDTAGKPSVAWRAGRADKEARRVADRAALTALRTKARTARASGKLVGAVKAHTPGS